MKKKSTDRSQKAPRKTNVADEQNSSGKGTVFPIVGVGASAGGLEAFTQLLKALPLDTGMGFVLVQHLDPDHESQLTQILARATSLPVHEITNDEPVRPNHVYVIPRDTNLSIAGGALKIRPRPRTRTPHRPIDSFFESLAQDRREQAVGVVLSGTASDGTLGLEAIKAEGGITFAQDDSAKHDSMPRSAVAAGCVDLVLSPAEIANELARIAKHPYVVGQPLLPPPKEGDTSPEEDRASATAHEDDETPLPSGGKGTPLTGAKQARAEAESAGDSSAGNNGRNGYRKIMLLLRNHSGVDFSLYKSTTIQRRINRRLVLSKLNTLDEYAGLLRGNAKELDALYSDVLISVTSFFRNPETFDVLQAKVLPELLRKPGDDPLRCWVLGCSTGQEAYSIAMAFSEAVEKAPRARTLQIFATDLNDALLDKARHGLYAKSLAEDITPERLRRFFVEESGGYRVRKALREMVVFARQNLIADPPFSRMDLVSCRNLLIYLEPSLHKKALPTFHFALNTGGFLLLGASEAIGGFTDLFEQVDKKHKIYSKKRASTPALHLPARKEHGTQLSPRSLLPIQAPGGPALPGQRGELDAQREADRITVHEFAPPGVLVNAELEVLQFRGPTGAFLEPPVGKASFNVLKMAREGLMLPLRSVINQARKDNKTARKEKVRVKQNGRTRTVNLEVIPLRNLRERCFLILFEEANKTSAERAPVKGKPARIGRSQGPEERRRSAELETELSDMREYLQSMQEQHEAANEEVQSANEEVQSANEELQSLNEELETSKEELESANEELTTVNDEMSNRNVELNRLNNDLTNFQTSTRLAILLLGRDLTIRLFSPQAEKQFDLLVADVGRPISNIRHGLIEVEQDSQPADRQASGPRQVPLDLESLVAGVIADVREQEREVIDKGGRWQSLRVRPYVTLDGKVDGAVLVLLDIDLLKRSERVIAAARDFAENIVDTIQEPLLVLDKDLRVQSANHSFFEAFRVDSAETIGRLIYDLGNRQWDIPNLRVLLEHIVPRDSKIEDFEVEHDFESLGRRTMLINARRVQLSDERASEQILVAIEDVTDRKNAEEKLRQAEQASAHLASIVTSSDDAIISKDLRGIILTWNSGAERLFGYSAEEVIGKPVTILIPADRADEEPEILKRMGRGESVDHFETVRQRKDGSLLDISLTISPIRDDDGHIIAASKIARDITERTQSERALRELNLELRENDERMRQYSAELSEAANRKNEFLAMLGHELRNPMSALGHGLEILGRVTEDAVRSEGVRAMMVRQTRRINTLLDQLLDNARVASDKVVLSTERIDLAEVLLGAVETVRSLSEAQKHELTVTLPKETVLVIGDAIRLTQVVENLLTNAIKYTDEGGQIALSLEADEIQARITLRDNGSGMSAELLPHVFELFTQAPRTLDRAKGGLGLGLPLVKRVVEMHGGSVSASSPGLGQGSEFIVRLPRLRERRTTERQDGKASEAEPGKVQPRRILVVDDEKDSAESLADLLEASGHEALPVQNASAALDAFRTFAPDVVLLDLGLPEMDGYEVARRIRDESDGKKVLLVAVTGYQNDDARLKEAGFDHHLIKPPDMRKLSALLAASENTKTSDKP